MSRLNAFLNWLIPPEEDDTPSVDADFLLGYPDRYKYMSVQEGEVRWCRCDLCGRLFELEHFPDLVEHVAEHDSQGAAEIDPFAETEHRTVIDDELIDEVEHWRQENVENEVEA